MRFLSTLFLYSLLVGTAFALGGSGAPVPCAATPPTQATIAGMTNLARCNTFGTNQNVDVNNTGAAGFNWYTQFPDTTYPATPASSYTNDGTGLSVITSDSYSLTTLGYSSAAPYWVGTPLYGSYYTEVDRKWNVIQPPGGGGDTHHPTFWTTGGLYSLNGSIVNGPPSTPMVEVDVLECNEAGAGNDCYTNQSLHAWSDISGTLTAECNISIGYGGSGINFANYNTYGLLYVTMADGGGTGSWTWYVNNVQTAQCTYTASTYACTAGSFIGPNCSSAAWIAAETQATSFMLTSGYNWPVTNRNFHVWQKP